MQAKLMRHEHVKVTSMLNAMQPRQACKMQHGHSSMQGKHVTTCKGTRYANIQACQMQLNMQQHVNEPSM